MKRAKLTITILGIFALIVCAVGLTACDTQSTFNSLVTSYTANMPNGDDVKEITWSADDQYVLEMDAEGNVVANGNDYIVCIEKDKDKDFVILNFADIQLGSTEISWEASFVETAKKTVAKLIEEVKPDLITLTGDQGYGEKLAYRTVYDYIDSFGIPWAPVFGNHDNQCRELSCAEQAVGLEQYEHCLFKTGPNNLAVVENGQPAYGNYIVNVVEKDGQSFKVVKSIIMINSGNNPYGEAEDHGDEQPVNDGNYAHLSTEQIAWYKWAVTGVQKYGNGGLVSSMVVLHIPIYAYNEAYCAASNADLDMYDYKAVDEYGATITIEQGKNDDSIWAEDYKDSTGVRHEGCYSPAYDDGVFDAILDYDDNAETTDVSTDLVIAGHDHINNYIINYQGVTLAYALKTGSGCYWDEDMNGGSVITIGSNGKASIEQHYYKISIPYLPRWAIVMIIVAIVVFMLVVIIVPTARNAKNKKRNK